jgi:enoyl-CoA hydratase
MGLVGYEVDGPVATLVIDDGKANALSPAMFGAIAEGLDRAEADGSVVVLRGRDGVFSGGFDLNVLRAGGEEALGMLRSGAALTERLLSFPAPVVVACTGHAVAMGLFTLLSTDLRIGPAGPYRFVANEVALGMTLPYFAVEVLRQRLAPAAFGRAAVLAEAFTPVEAVAAGILDRVVPADEVVSMAHDAGHAMALLDRSAHVATKRRVREPVLRALREAIARDDEDFVALMAPADVPAGAPAAVGPAPAPVAS